ncbi:hypothetical protein BH11MYX2_BH11MYX2_38910 [soil metagenome]
MLGLRASLVIVVALSSSAAIADKKPEQGFYKILVKPKATWVLPNAMSEPNAKDKVIVETYDVRKVGEADVARIRWTYSDDDGGKSELASQGELPTQVAVTAKGLYLLTAADDDAKITKALAKKPSRTAPPKTYKGTKINNGRFLSIDATGEVCMGYRRLPGHGDCEDVCEAQFCIDGTDGIVELSGTWAPGFVVFRK